MSGAEPAVLAAGAGGTAGTAGTAAGMGLSGAGAAGAGAAGAGAGMGGMLPGMMNMMGSMPNPMEQFRGPALPPPSGPRGPITTAPIPPSVSGMLGGGVGPSQGGLSELDLIELLGRLRR